MTGPNFGIAPSDATAPLLYGCAALIKSTLSFQTLEAALPLGILCRPPIQQRDSSPYPGIGCHWFDSGGKRTVRMEGS